MNHRWIADVRASLADVIATHLMRDLPRIAVVQGEPWGDYSIDGEEAVGLYDANTEA